MSRTKLFQFVFFVTLMGAPSTRLEATQIDFTVAGSIGGYCSSMDIVGHYAYIGEGPHLTILDMTNLTSPTLISRTRIEHPVTKIKVVGSRALVRLDNGRIVDYNIFKPEKPVMITPAAQLIYVSDIESSGTLSFVGTLKTLRILDYASPTTPTLISDFTTSDTIWDIAISENLALVLTENSLLFLDISEPAQPRLLNDFHYSDPFDFRAGRVEVHDNLAFLGGNGGSISAGGMYILDIGNPLQPIIIAKQGVESLDSPFAFEVIGSSLYVALRELAVYNISDPTTPTRFTKTIPAREGQFRDLNRINGKLLALGQSGLQIFDAGSAEDLVEIGAFETLTETGLVKTSESVGYVMAQGPEFVLGRDLKILDYSDLNRIRVIRTLRGFLSFDIEDKLMASLMDDPYRMEIRDISDPASPNLIGTYALNEATKRAVQLEGKQVYIWQTGTETNPQQPEFKDELLVLNMEDPTSPTLLGTVQWNNRTLGRLRVSGSNVFIHDAGYQLIIIDAADPRHPIVKSRYSNPYRQAALMHDAGSLPENLIYFPVGRQGIEALDITDLSNPISRGLLTWPEGEVQQVLVKGRWGYATDEKTYLIRGMGFNLLDLSDPFRPTLVASHDTPGYAVDFDLTRDLIYVSDHYAGVLVLHNPVWDLEENAAHAWTGYY